MSRLNLNNDWRLFEAPLSWQKDRLAAVLRKEGEYMACSLPCDVRMPLIAAGKIEEPVEADNFRRSMWVEQRSWWFVKSFDWAAGTHDAVELSLDRLDFGADIFLNGVHIGRHDSVHYPFMRDVREFLLTGSNILAVRVTCGLETVTDEDVAGLDGLVFTEENNGCKERGDMRRPFIRKPQYAFGWDWGPRIATCGIGSASIDAYDRVVIRNVMLSTLSVNKGTARVSVKAVVESLLPTSTQDADLEVILSFKGDRAVSEIRKDVLLLSGRNYLDFELVITDAKLWWPNGYGEQSLYALDVKVVSGDASAADHSEVGIRTMALDTSRLDGDNRRFAIVVNGVPIQCKGGNWIPSDSIYARISDEKYEKLLAEAAEANFTMLRIWGGGLYEKDIFYTLCDRLGLLVWQDFMFACTAYPDYLESFRLQVYKELDWQTLRLGGRACLAVFSGNNENHWLVHASRPDLGGLYAYNTMAPAAVHRNAPYVPWWPSSPYGGTFPNDNNVGDRHHWQDCMMNAEMEKRITPEEYDLVESKFVSEYGYPGPCSLKSIEQYFGGRPIDRSGEIWNLHNNTFEKHTVAAGIKKHYVEPDGLSLEQYLLYASQVQSLMLGYSLEAIRNKPDCMGSLFWMYNDCWGETGWTIIDYYLRRKPSFYAVKRAFSSKKLILREKAGFVEVTAHNETNAGVTLDLEYGYVSFDGKVRESMVTAVVLPAHSKSVVLTFKADNHDDRKGVWFARAEGLDTATLRRAPFRELSVANAIPEILNLRNDGNNVIFDVKANGFAHAVHFSMSDDCIPSDEYFDLLPGEKKQVSVKTGLALATISDMLGNIDVIGGL